MDLVKIPMESTTETSTLVSTSSEFSSPNSTSSLWENQTVVLTTGEYNVTFELQTSYSTLVDERWPYLFLLFISLLSMAMNLVVLVTIAARRMLHRTIFYLIASLAVSDIIHALSIILPDVAQILLAGCWWPESWGCRAWLGVDGLLEAVTLSHLCLAVCDSHTALLRPLQYQLRQVSSYAALSVALTWILAVLFSTPYIILLILFPIRTHESVCEQPVCWISRPDQVLTRLGTTLILPCLALTGLYLFAYRAIKQQAKVIQKMQSEAHSGTTSNGDVTGLDCLERELVSEKTITQTIDICCQLAGVGPISNGVGPVANGHAVIDSCQDDEAGPNSDDNQEEPKPASEGDGLENKPEQEPANITKVEEANETSSVHTSPARSPETTPHHTSDETNSNNATLPCVDVESGMSTTNYDHPATEAPVGKNKAKNFHIMHDYYYSTFDEEIAKASEYENNTVECVAEVHVATDDLELAKGQSEGDNCKSENPAETAVKQDSVNPEAHVMPNGDITDKARLPLPAEETFEARDTEYGIGSTQKSPQQKLVKKRSKEALNGTEVDVSDVTIDIPMVTNGVDNEGYHDDEDYYGIEEEDETPLATAIKVTHVDSVVEEQPAPAVYQNGGLGHTPTRQHSMASSGCSSPTEGPHRSILRRDASQRSTVRKSVKFAATVSTKKIESRRSTTTSRVTSGRRRVQRQGSLKNPNRLKRQQSVCEDDNPPTVPPPSKPSSKKEKQKSSKEKNKEPEKPICLLQGLQMDTSKSPTEYLAQLHQRQGQRMTLRLCRQRSMLTLVVIMALTFLLLNLPLHALRVVFSFCDNCKSVSVNLIHTLQWLAHTACLVNPFIYIIVCPEFRMGLRTNCCQG